MGKSVEELRKELNRLKSKQEIETIGQKRELERQKLKAEISEMKYGKYKRFASRIGSSVSRTTKNISKRMSPKPIKKRSRSSARKPTTQRLPPIIGFEGFS